MRIPNEFDSNALPHTRGINDRYVTREDFIALFSDFLDTQLYGKGAADNSGTSDANENEYITNRTFWTDSIHGRHFDAYQVRCQCG